MPFWSPDGKFIAFFAGSKLRRLDVASGTVVDVCDVPQARGGRGPLMGSSWSACWEESSPSFRRPVVR